MTHQTRGRLDAPALSGAYRAVWRWHFYAGLLVLPVLCLMALTGGVYLFKDEIDAAAYRSFERVQARATMTSPDRWVAAASVGAGGEVLNLRVPDRPDRAVRVTVRRPDGEQRTAFVDPHDAQYLGSTRFGGVTEIVKRIHSLEIIGRWANLIVEVVAGWAMILVATGVVLWWPRRREAGVMTVRARTGRPLWRDIHAVTGLYAGGVIFFLAFTGMPWSAVWGAQFHKTVAERGLGKPPAPAATSWEHAEHGAEPQGVGWTLEGQVMTTAHAAPEPDLSRVLARVETEGLARPFLINVPDTPARAVTVAHEARRVEDARTLYIQGDGALLADIGARDYGVGAKAFEWGIYTHQGTQYGQINRIVMLGGCIAVWLLAISALMMWWKRRPKGRLGAPTAPPGPRVRAAVLGIVLPLAILYPLTGLSLLIAFALDRGVAALRRRLPA